MMNSPKTTSADLSLFRRRLLGAVAAAACLMLALPTYADGYVSGDTGDKLDIGGRNSKTLHPASKQARPARRHEGARTKQIVFAPPRHHVAEIEQPRQTPAVVITKEAPNYRAE